MFYSASSGVRRANSLEELDWNNHPESGEAYRPPTPPSPSTQSMPPGDEAGTPDERKGTRRRRETSPANVISPLMTRATTDPTTLVSTGQEERAEGPGEEVEGGNHQASREPSSPSSSPPPFATLTRLVQGESTFWIDITEPTVEDMLALSKVFKIHPLTAEDVLAEPDETRDKCDIYQHYAFLVYSTFHQIRSPPQAQDNPFTLPLPVTMPFFIILLRHGVISVSMKREGESKSKSERQRE